MTDFLSQQQRERVIESLPSPEKTREMEIRYREALLSQWRRVQNHAIAEGAEYHRDR